MFKNKKIVIASNNDHKVLEFKIALEKLGYEVVSQKEFDNVPDVEENGDSFEANATLKAQALVDHIELPVIADDSGLVVPALNGEPGIYSARYAGDHDDLANNNKLLNELKSHDDRSAHFVTYLVMMNPNGDKLVVSGKVDGEILYEPVGNNGFGYDPLFYVPIFEKSMAQLTMEEKNSISHRGNAIKNLISKLR